MYTKSDTQNKLALSDSTVQFKILVGGQGVSVFIAIF